MAYIICKSPSRERDGEKEERRNRGAKVHCTNACPWIKFHPSHPLSSFLFLYLLSPCNEPFKPTGIKFFSPHSTKIHCVGPFGPRPDHLRPGQLKSCPYKIYLNPCNFFIMVHLLVPKDKMLIPSLLTISLQLAVFIRQ